MMNTQQLRIFEAYLNNEMSLSERVEFQSRLEKEADLAAEYESFCMIVKGIRDFGKERQIMNVDQELLIFDFLNDNLTDQKREAVMRRMETDEIFAREVEESKAILQSIKEEKEESIVQKLNQVRKELETEGFFNKSADTGAIVHHLKRKERSWRPILSVAAGIAVIIGLGIGYRFYQQKNVLKPKNSWSAEWMGQKSEGMKWVGQKIQMAESESSVKGYVQGKEQSGKALIPSLKLLKDGKWGKAIDSLNMHLSKYPEDRYAQFALAQALICDQNTDAEGIKTAIDILSNEKLKNEIGHEEAIEWSLALAYLRQPDTRYLGMQIIDEIIEKGSDFAEPAKQLKKEKNENQY